MQCYYAYEFVSLKKLKGLLILLLKYFIFEHIKQFITILITSRFGLKASRHHTDGIHHHRQLATVLELQ